MIEQIILEFLSENLAIPVYMEIPPRPPAVFVLVEKTGSSIENFIKRATIAVQCYADTMYNAALLNEDVKTLMLGSGDGYDEGITVHPDISKCELNSDYNATDTLNKRYRYQAVYDLVHL